LESNSFQETAPSLFPGTKGPPAAAAAAAAAAVGGAVAPDVAGSGVKKFTYSDDAFEDMDLADGGEGPLDVRAKWRASVAEAVTSYTFAINMIVVIGCCELI
jgi:hypothetical protein